MGVKITMKNIDIYRNNYEKLWGNLERDILKWNKLNLLLMGRTVVVKMNILSRILFIFQTIPVVKTIKHLENGKENCQILYGQAENQE